MWRCVPLSLFGLLAACGDQTCSAALCSGSALQLPLVDEAGASVPARGEYRTNRELPEQRPFDCTVGPRASDFDSDCNDNVVLAAPLYRGPGSTVEVRFQQADGSRTEWQDVALTFEYHTDPDFNGPGCGCSWYTAVAEPIIVPAGARLTEPDPMPPGG
jgi:hypothetical protein